MPEELDNELDNADLASVENVTFVDETTIVPPATSTYTAPQQQVAQPQVPLNYPAPGYHPYPYGQPGYYPAHRPTTDGFAIAALVCGIAGLVFAAPVIGSILGVIFGIVALNRIRDTGVGGRPLAIAGIVTGAVGLLLGFIVLAGIIHAAVFWNPYWM